MTGIAKNQIRNNVITQTPEGRVGVNNDNPQSEFDVNGGVRIGDSNEEVAGNTRFRGGFFEGYNGTEWVQLGQTINIEQGLVPNTPVPPLAIPDSYVASGITAFGPLLVRPADVSTLTSPDTYVADGIEVSPLP